MKGFFRIALSVFFLGILTVFLLSPQLTAQAVTDGMRYCATVLIPSLFPGYVISGLLIALLPNGRGRRGLLFPESGWLCWGIGLLSGFPVSAEMCVRAYRNGALTKRQAEDLCAFICQPGVVFVLGAVGNGIFGNIAVGVELWGCLVFSSLLTGILFRRSEETTAPKPIAEEKISFTSLFPSAVLGAVRSVFSLSGFVVFFRVLIAVFARKGGILRPILSGLLEMTCGLSALTPSSPRAVPLAAGILAWSGCSVHFQILNVLSPSDLSASRYLAGKAVQTGFAVFCALFFTGIRAGSFVLCLPACVAVGAAILIGVKKEISNGKRNSAGRTGTSCGGAGIY